MNWFTKAAMGINRFMYGRYGGDMLSFAIIILYCVLVFIANIAKLPVLSLLALALLIWGIYRVFSKNILRRTRENDWFLRHWNRISSWFRRIAHKFSSLQKQKTLAAKDKAIYKCYKCPKCRNRLRVPRGKGRISIKCPVCGTEFIKKT
jgi:ribosomal protein S27E